jgi:thioredoxin 1
MNTSLNTLSYVLAVIGIAGLAWALSACRVKAGCPILGLCRGPASAEDPQSVDATGAYPADADTTPGSFQPDTSTESLGEIAMSIANSRPAVEGKVEYAGTESFSREVLESDIPTLVDFYADWCGPCRALSPTLDELARETPGAKIVKVNVDENPELAARYDVTSIPSLAVFKDGQVTARHLGLASKAQLKALLSP